MRGSGSPRPQRKNKGSPDPLARRLYVVARDHPQLYEALKREFAEDSDWVQVVLDRRHRTYAPSERAWKVSRRTKIAEVIDADLRRLGWAVVVYG